jgi:thiol-disulfide isomerase/thioredoxin
MIISLLVMGLLVACGSGGPAVVEQSANERNDMTRENQAAEPQGIRTDLPDLGVAPEINNEMWINTAAPLTLASQQGKVVLLEFWTFGCINCQRVIPWVKSWHEKYEGDDFTVISIHYPEFSYEEDFNNVLEATEEFGIEYAVALDNDGKTWRAYQQRFWPTTYLIDKTGQIRYQHIGEFSNRSAGVTELAIQSLMAEPDQVVEAAE